MDPRTLVVHTRTRLPKMAKSRTWISTLPGCFGSTASLVCMKGTPVADMLAHSPPIPLVIDYFREYYNITAEDEVGTILALKQHDRVRRVRLLMPLSNLQRLIVAMDEEYPILECLILRIRLISRTGVRT